VQYTWFLPVFLLICNFTCLCSVCVGGPAGGRTSKTISEVPSFCARSPPTAAAMRRSASFDTIATSYLSGRWPHHHCCQFASVAAPGGGCVLPRTGAGTGSAGVASLMSRPIVLTFDKSTQVSARLYIGMLFRLFLGWQFLRRIGM
jgi:hypothetical protein